MRIGLAFANKLACSKAFDQLQESLLQQVELFDGVLSVGNGFREVDQYQDCTHAGGPLSTRLTLHSTSHVANRFV